MTFGANTPTTLTPPVLEFCQHVVPSGEPEYVLIAVSPYAEHLYCVPAVEKHVEERGGEVQLGWQIRQWPGVLFEAIFHAVWRDPTGKLRDITPSPDKPSRTLFLPDASAKYECGQVNSIREPINNSPGGRLMIEAQEEEFELANRGERAHQHGELVLKRGGGKRVSPDPAEEGARHSNDRGQRQCSSKDGAERTLPLRERQEIQEVSRRSLGDRLALLLLPGLDQE